MRRIAVSCAALLMLSCLALAGAVPGISTGQAAASAKQTHTTRARHCRHRAHGHRRARCPRRRPGTRHEPRRLGDAWPSGQVQVITPPVNGGGTGVETGGNGPAGGGYEACATGTPHLVFWYQHGWWKLNYWLEGCGRYQYDWGAFQWTAAPAALWNAYGYRDLQPYFVPASWLY